MAGIIGIYGLVVSVLISDNLKQELPLFNSFIQLGAGLSVGLAGLAAGYVVSTLTDRTTSDAYIDSPLVSLVTLVCVAQHSSPVSSSA